MNGEAMSLKAKIRNLAKKKDISAQVVLQNYMFERFLERLSKSAYRDKFILKCETRFFRATGSQYREPLAHGDQSRRRGAESHRSKHKYKEPPELRRRQLFVFNQLNVWKYCL